MALKNILWIIIAGSLCFSSYARVLQYFPRDEDVESVSTSKIVNVGEVNCDVLGGLYQRLHDCQECMTLKRSCPDCCLVYDCCSANDHYEAIRCRIGDDPDYPAGCDTKYIFSASNCPAVTLSNSEESLLKDCSVSDIPHAQKRGCPGITLGPKGGQRCIQQGNKWYCNADDVLPRFSGCTPQLSTIPLFTGNYYNVKEISGLSCPPSVIKAGKCYRYTPASEYEDYISMCEEEVDKREDCGKKIYCCRQNVCEAGFDNNCVNCEQRKDRWEAPDKKVKTLSGLEKECRQLKMQDCVDLENEVMDCINAMSGNACDSCFREVYPGWYYKFVGKSGEEVAILWKLFAQSLTEDNTRYFYSKIKVWDDDENMVYESIVHQKAFLGNFSIFNVAALSKDKIEQGKTYYVKIYYFIPDDNDPSTNLQVRINGAEITAIKIRE